jgi:hypothetical protein
MKRKNEIKQTKRNYKMKLEKWNETGKWNEIGKQNEMKKWKRKNEIKCIIRKEKTNNTKKTRN